MPEARVRTLARDGDPGRGVIFLHGVTSSASTWEPFLATLPEGLLGIAFDLLGSGYTDRRGARGPLSRSDLRRQLMSVAEALGVERFAAVGHSMGCGPALGAAWRHPERVAGLLLESPATQGRRKLSPTLRAARIKPLARLMEAAAPLYLPAMTRARLKELARGGAVDEELERREAAHALERPRETVRGFVDLVGHGDLRRASQESENYRKITQPVWIVRGGGDRDWMPKAHEDRYRELIPHSRLIRWDDTRHWPHIEEPDRFRALLAEFLDETLGDPA